MSEEVRHPQRGKWDLNHVRAPTPPCFTLKFTLLLNIASELPSPLLTPSAVPPSVSQISFNPELPHRQSHDSNAMRPASVGAFGLGLGQPSESLLTGLDYDAFRRRRRQLNVTDGYEGEGGTPPAGRTEFDDLQVYGEEDNRYSGSGTGLYEEDWWVKRPIKRWRAGDPERYVPPSTIE